MVAQKDVIEQLVLEEKKQPTSFAFLDLLRILGAWLVVYDHIFSVWPDGNGKQLQSVLFIRNNINVPFGLIQDFGWLGVVIFFLISGFVIAHVSKREHWRSFLLKRIFRIYPMLVLAVFLSLLLFQGGGKPVTFSAVIANLTLVNYWIEPQIILVGVGWTLAIEISFYLFVLILLPFKLTDFTRISLMLLMATSFIFFSSKFGANFFLFAATIAYIPYLILGYILYIRLISKTISLKKFVFLFLACYSIIYYGLKEIHFAFLPISNSYLVGSIFALLLFILAYVNEEDMPRNYWVKILSDTSYSLYLFHGIIGFYLLSLLVPRVGFSLSALISLIFVCVFVWIVNRWIEKPVLKIGRNLIVKINSQKQFVS